MQSVRCAVLFALLLACSSSMLAFDPGIHVDDPQGPGTPVGLSFTFTSDALGGGVLNFVNTSGMTFVNLQIDVPPPQPIAPIICGGNAYTHCFQQSLTVAEYATLDFFGGPGIPDGAMFQVDLGSTGWTPDATFQAFANVKFSTPEPGVLILFATAASAAWLRWKLLGQD
jgi:hypothetical protein